MWSRLTPQKGTWQSSQNILQAKRAARQMELCDVSSDHDDDEGPWWPRWPWWWWWWWWPDHLKAWQCLFSFTKTSQHLVETFCSFCLNIIMLQSVLSRKKRQNCTAPLPHSFLHNFHYHKTFLFKSIFFQWEIHPNPSHTYLKFHENLCHQRLVNPVHRVLGQPLVLVDLHHTILGPAIYRLKEGRMQKEKGKVWYFTKLPSDPNPWFFSP